MVRSAAKPCISNHEAEHSLQGARAFILRDGACAPPQNLAAGRSGFHARSRRVFDYEGPLPQWVASRGRSVGGLFHLNPAAASLRHRHFGRWRLGEVDAAGCRLIFVRAVEKLLQASVPLVMREARPTCSGSGLNAGPAGANQGVVSSRTFCVGGILPPGESTERVGDATAETRPARRPIEWFHARRGWACPARP